MPWKLPGQVFVFSLSERMKLKNVLQEGKKKTDLAYSYVMEYQIWNQRGESSKGFSRIFVLSKLHVHKT